MNHSHSNVSCSAKTGQRKATNESPTTLRACMKPTMGPFLKQGLRLVFLACALHLDLTAAESSRIKLVRTPDDGIQPQAAVDQQGVVHLIYYKGDSGGGDIFYVRQQPGQEV